MDEMLPQEMPQNPTDGISLVSEDIVNLRTVGMIQTICIPLSIVLIVISIIICIRALSEKDIQLKKKKIKKMIIFLIITAIINVLAFAILPVINFNIRMG